MTLKRMGRVMYKKAGFSLFCLPFLFYVALLIQHNFTVTMLQGKPKYNVGESWTRTSDTSNDRASWTRTSDTSNSSTRQLKWSQETRIPIILSYIQHPKGWFSAYGIDEQCEHRCLFTNDTRLYNASDAVIFFRTLAKNPPKKFAHQKWIYFTNEPPTQISPFGKNWMRVSSNIDWLLSYRPNSDFVFPFGVLKKSETTMSYNYSYIYSQKQRNVAWLVSHCSTSSAREKYVRELAKHIDVDIYGDCGDKKCPSTIQKPEDFTECKTYISKKYKFYLAFENSLCENYVTEKAFDIYENYNTMIPVVRGAPNAESFLPNGTYVSTSKFQSPEDLAKYLKLIGSSEWLYTSILRDKMSYSLQQWLQNFRPTICRICTALTLGQHSSKGTHILTKLKEDKCHKPNDF